MKLTIGLAIVTLLVIGVAVFMTEDTLAVRLSRRKTSKKMISEKIEREMKQVMEATNGTCNDACADFSRRIIRLGDVEKDVLEAIGVDGCPYKFVEGDCPYDFNGYFPQDAINVRICKNITIEEFKIAEVRNVKFHFCDYPDKDDKSGFCVMNTTGLNTNVYLTDLYTGLPHIVSSSAFSKCRQREW